MKVNKIFFYFKKFTRDFSNPLIYKTMLDKNQLLREYYFAFDEKELLKGGSQDFHMDDNGIPIIPTYVDIEKKSFHYYPIAISQYGLAVFHTYLKSNKENDKIRFLNIANWFVEHQSEDGYWTANVEEKKYCLPLHWVSSMAQGRGISILLRAAQITKNEKYIISAELALNTFSINSLFLNKFENNIFYEEYPSSPGSFVLNGMIFSLFGLYDFVRYSNNADALTYFNKGVNSLNAMIGLYDTGYWSYYDLRHLTWDSSYLNPGTVHYHYIHIKQLEVMYYLTGYEVFNNYCNSWKKYDTVLNKLKMYFYKYKAIKKRQA